MSIVGKANVSGGMMAAMNASGRPTLPLDQAERLLAVLTKRKDERHNGNQSALARELGIAPPTLYAIMNRRHSLSYATMVRLAALEGVTVEELLGTAPAEPPGGEHAGLPNLRALMQSTDWRDATSEARALVLDEANRSGGDLPIGEWAAALRLAQRRRPAVLGERTRDVLGREVGEEDVVEDPDEDK